MYLKQIKLHNLNKFCSSLKTKTPFGKDWRRSWRIDNNVAFQR
jgi:hypothetical protein